MSFFVSFKQSELPESGIIILKETRFIFCLCYCMSLYQTTPELGEEKRSFESLIIWTCLALAQKM